MNAAALVQPGQGPAHVLASNTLTETGSLDTSRSDPDIAANRDTSNNQ